MVLFYNEATPLQDGSVQHVDALLAVVPARFEQFPGVYV
jgi:hypothetical protein